MGNEVIWRNVLLEDLAASTRNALVGGPFGSDLVSSDYSPEGVPVIRGENLSLGRWVSGNFVFVPTTKAEKLSANTAGPLDIVFTQRGANHYRQVAVVPADCDGRFVISQSQMKLTVDLKKAEPLFVYYLFCAPEQQEFLQRNAIQAGVPHTNLGILRKVPLRIPPLSLQRAIVHILGALDDKIELNRRSAEILEAMARALFKSWFVSYDPVRAKAEGRPTGLPDDISALFPGSLGDDGLPQSWEFAPAGTLFDISGGNTPSTKSEEYWNGTHEWATPKDLSNISSPVLLRTERRLSDAGLALSNSGLLPVGSLLLSSRAPIGYMAFATQPTAINQGFAGFKRREISTTYAWCWCIFNMSVLKAIAGGSTFPEISKAVLREVPMLRPDRAILQEFARIADPLVARMIALAAENRTLEETRDTLLPRLISGELRIRDAESAIEAA